MVNDKYNAKSPGLEYLRKDLLGRMQLHGHDVYHRPGLDRPPQPLWPPHE